METKFYLEVYFVARILHWLMKTAMVAKAEIKNGLKPSQNIFQFCPRAKARGNS
jgi:hypothetical protein